MSTNKNQIVYQFIINIPKGIEATTETNDPPLSNSNERTITHNDNEADKNILFDVSGFSTYFKVSENTARAWIKKGLIPVIKINKRIRIRKEEILKLEKSRRQVRNK